MNKETTISLNEFIQNNKPALIKELLAKGETYNLSDENIELWIWNDTDLWFWALHEGVEFI